MQSTAQQGQDGLRVSLGTSAAAQWSPLVSPSNTAVPYPGTPLPKKHSSQGACCLQTIRVRTPRLWAHQLPPTEKLSSQPKWYSEENLGEGDQALQHFVPFPARLCPQKCSQALRFWLDVVSSRVTQRAMLAPAAAASRFPPSSPLLVLSEFPSAIKGI